MKLPPTYPNRDGPGFIVCRPLQLWFRSYERYYRCCMDSDTVLELPSNSSEDTLRVGERLGSSLSGGEIIELKGDIGSGKTVFVRGVVRGMGSRDSVMSPTFTISRIYTGNGVDLHHFDFYRLRDPGIMRAELSESVDQADVSVVIEWSGIVEDVLPKERLQVEFKATSGSERSLTFRATDRFHKKLLGRLQ